MTEGQKYYAKICVLFSTPLNQHGFFLFFSPPGEVAIRQSRTEINNNNNKTNGRF